MRNKLIAGLIGLMLMAPVMAQAPQKELIYAVLTKNGTEAAKVSVVQEGMKFTVEGESLVVSFQEIQLLEKAIGEINK